MAVDEEAMGSVKESLGPHELTNKDRCETNPDAMDVDPVTPAEKSTDSSISLMDPIDLSANPMPYPRGPRHSRCVNGRIVQCIDLEDDVVCLFSKLC